MILAIEELSLNALPALQTYFLDGWVLRFANGYTRRANSVNPLYPCASSVKAKIETCEELYRAAHLPVIFKLTSASEPDSLDTTLAQRGYRTEAPTSVQICQALPHSDETDPALTVFEGFSEEWFGAFCTMNQIASVHHETLHRMLSMIVPQTGFALLQENGTPLACGLGVLDQNAIGLYDIVVAPAERRQGLGTRLIPALLAWGAGRGADMAYLQVALTNEPALALYKKLGFVEQHRYWYRVHA